MLFRQSIRSNKRVAFFVLAVILLFSLFSFLALNYFGIFKPQNHKSSSLEDNNVKQELCTRTKAFPLDPQFNNSLDLIAQRSKNAEALEAKNIPTSSKIPRYFPVLDYRNCIDIFYSDRIPDLKNTSAWFDSESSTPNHLIIKVNPVYQNQKIDNLVMAMLLAHELTHVQQYFDIRSGVKMTCLQQETDAFLWQIRFLAILNRDEQPKLMNLVKTKYYYILGTFYDLWIQEDKATTQCNEMYQGKSVDQNTLNVCFWDKMETVAEKYIETIPGYQEHCKLK